MRFVDTNVFIYTLVGSPKEAYHTSIAILKRIEGGEETLTTTAIVQEVATWLEYNNRKKEVGSFMTAVNSYISLRKQSPNWEDCLGAIKESKEYDLDYVDALTVQMMRKNGVKEIYTNDKDFDRVREVNRVWR